MPAEAITFFRLILGSIFMLFYLMLSGQVSRIKTRPSLPVCINGLFLAGFIIFYVQAMNFTTMANAIMLVLFGWALFHENLTTLQIAGCLVILLCGIARAVKS